MMSDDQLSQIVSRISYYVLKHPRRGVSHLELREQFPAYRKLTPEDRFRLQVLLFKQPELAVVVGSTPCFYGRYDAPPGAFNIEDAKRTRHSEAIGRAMRWA